MALTTIPPSSHSTSSHISGTIPFSQREIYIQRCPLAPTIDLSIDPDTFDMVPIDLFFDPTIRRGWQTLQSECAGGDISFDMFKEYIGDAIDFKPECDNLCWLGALSNQVKPISKQVTFDVALEVLH